ncbi:Response regulator receiver domain-containing protein [Malonomonas rubra DSM 5091]|uniref:Response regulator receiver domain-containing protein n=1 Tax=Malonomonas rubra DSM 5091 TaxID=1122189 RepID=A0A1M6NEU6_MALRU|nr:response regulator [Malonomonas rubra]SHJ94144.1 Response regulator receiver domain-containing protein [Malonomonas rubra DSM 5091]
MTCNDKKNPSRIIVVDDNLSIHADFRKILCGEDFVDALLSLEASILGKSNSPHTPNKYEVDFASQGQEALKMVVEAEKQGQPYSVAFIDSRMPPGWDGIETIKNIWKVSPALQVVLCTAYADYSWEEIQKSLGETDSLIILKKPFENVEVMQLVHALSSKWLMSREIELDLRETIKQRDLLYHQAPVGYVTLDSKGCIRELNETFASFCAGSIAELKNSFLGDLLSEKSSANFLQQLNSFFYKPEGQVLSVWLKANRKDEIYLKIQGERKTYKDYLACTLIDTTNEKKATEEIKTLRGILPICMYCKGIRDDKGYWNKLEKYISEHSLVEFSHGICNECMKEKYPEQYEKLCDKK